MLKKLHLRVRGSVHGVGFRNYVQSIANELGLSGWVRNRQDDSVEIEAIGALSPLEDFFEQVKQGPPNAVIADTEDTWSDYGGTLASSFHVAPTK